jgi:mono/diheme cytochrome c family protein
MRTFLYFSVLCIVLTSCGQEEQAEKPAKNDYPVARTKMIYSGMCALCHGVDGTMQISGAKDLSESTLTLPERIVMIKHGKGTMTPFKDRLSDEEIKHLAMYLESLRKP